MLKKPSHKGEQPNGTARCAKCRQERDHPFHAPKGIFGSQMETHDFVNGTAESPRPKWELKTDEHRGTSELVASSGISAARDLIEGLAHQALDAERRIEELTESIQQLQERHDKLKAAFNENEKLTDSLLKSLEERDNTIQQLRSYAQHKGECEEFYGTSLNPIHLVTCTCGLDDVLKAIGGGK